MAQRELPERSGNAFAPRDRPKHGTEAQKPAPVAAAPPAAPGPPPFKYVGKVARDAQAYAVLLQDDRVLMVRAGEKLGERYRVESISESAVVLLNLDYGVAQSLAFSAPTAPNATFSNTTPGVISIDDVSLQLSGPAQVALGQEFTLTVSLDAGANGALDTGRVELRYDPKLLEVAGQPQSSGATRVDIAGAYAGHPAPATEQFRVVATAPAATEIRVVPTNIADSDGRLVGVNTPQAHRLRIVGGGTPATGN